MARPWHRFTTYVLALLRPAPDSAPVVAAAGKLTLGQVLRRFWPRLRPLRGWLILGLLLLAAAPAIVVVEILLYGRLVDDVLEPAGRGAGTAVFGTLLGLALLYIGLNVLSGIVDGADDYLGTWISQRFLVDLRRETFEHVLSQPSSAHDRRRLGDTMARLTSSPVEQGSGKPNRTAARPVGHSATISKP